MSEYVLLYWCDEKLTSVLERKQSHVSDENWYVGAECEVPFGNTPTRGKKPPTLYRVKIVAIHNSKEFLDNLSVCAETGELLIGNDILTRTKSEKKLAMDEKRKRKLRQDAAVIEVDKRCRLTPPIFSQSPQTSQTTNRTVTPNAHEMRHSSHYHASPSPMNQAAMTPPYANRMYQWPESPTSSHHPYRSPCWPSHSLGYSSNEEQYKQYFHVPHDVFHGYSSNQPPMHPSGVTHTYTPSAEEKISWEGAGSSVALEQMNDQTVVSGASGGASPSELIQLLPPVRQDNSNEGNVHNTRPKESEVPNKKMVETENGRIIEENIHPNTNMRNKETEDSGDESLATVVQDAQSQEDQTERSISVTATNCQCNVCCKLRPLATPQALLLLDALKETLMSTMANDKSLVYKKPANHQTQAAVDLSYMMPGKDKAQLVKHHPVYLNISDLQSAYIAADGDASSLIRQLLLKLIDVEELKIMTARGKGKVRRIPNQIMDALTLCANNLIAKKNLKITDQTKLEKPLTGPAITKIVNTFLEGLRLGYHQEDNEPKKKPTKTSKKSEAGKSTEMNETKSPEAGRETM